MTLEQRTSVRSKGGQDASVIADIEQITVKTAQLQ